MAGGVGGIIVWAFILAGIVALLGLGSFLWLNWKSSSIDDRSYDQTFHPEKLVSKYRWRGRGEADDAEAARMLRRYIQRPSPAAPKLTAERETADETEIGEGERYSAEPPLLEEVRIADSGPSELKDAEPESSDSKDKGENN